ISVTISIGGISTQRYARTVDDAIAFAQEALDISKRYSAGAFRAWSPNAGRESLRRQNIRVTNEISEAIAEGRMMIAFEPVVSATSREVVFHECLVRMARPDGQIQSAPQIVPAAERLGLIRMVDRRVLELAIAELKAWPDIQLSVNISPETTTDQAWLSSIESLLDNAAGVAGRLIVEIT